MKHNLRVFVNKKSKGYKTYLMLFQCVPVVLSLDVKCRLNKSATQLSLEGLPSKHMKDANFQIE